MSSGLPTPIEPVWLPVLERYEIRLDIKRDDLIHPHIIGNKLRKSLGYLDTARSDDTLLTFGGRFSNHLLAIAQAGAERGLETIGIVRGTDIRGDSPVLAECRRLGMQLLTVATEDYYPLQNVSGADLAARFDLGRAPVVIPEGGTSAKALDGVAGIITEIADLSGYDFLVCASGTGGTAASLVYGLTTRPDTRLPQVLALSVVKGYITLPLPGRMALEARMGSAASDVLARQLVFDGSAPFGRYGKPGATVIQRLSALQALLPFPIDYVYTGKALLHLLELIEAGRFSPGARLLFLHTGGYQTAAVKPAT